MNGTLMTRSTPIAIHPGEFLIELLEDAAISQAEFARRIEASPMRISHVVHGTRPVTAELALRFARAFGQTPPYWLNLQSDFDLKTAQSALGKSIAHIPALLAA
jgi:addiction module HigA family antidote